MKTKWQGKFARIVICLMIGILVTAVSVPALAAEKVTIKYWMPWGGMWQEQEQQVIDSWDNPNIKVDLVHVSYTGFQEKLMTAIAAGSPPDVVTIFSYQYQMTLAQQGVLMALDDLIKDDPEIREENYYPGTWVYGLYKGKRYFIIKGPNTAAFVWGKKSFRDAGLDPGKGPKTWNEVGLYSEKLFQKDAKGKITRIGMLPWAHSWGAPLSWYMYWGGGEWYDQKTAKFNAANPLDIEALQWMVDYVNKYGGADMVADFTAALGESPIDTFLSNMEAMRSTNPYYFVYMDKYQPDFEYGFAPLPKNPNIDPSIGPILGCGSASFIPVGAKHVKEGFAYLRYLVTEGELFWRELHGGLTSTPAKNERMKWPEVISAALAKVYTDTLKIARAAPLVPVASLMYTRLTAEADKALRNQISAEQALMNVTAAVQEALDELE